MTLYGNTLHPEDVFGGPARVFVRKRSEASPLNNFPYQIGDVLDLSSKSPEDIKTAAATAGWLEIGATIGGTTLNWNTPSNEISVDHETIGYERQNADASVQTNMAEQSVRNILFAIGELSRIRETDTANEYSVPIDLDDSVPQEFQMMVAGKDRDVVSMLMLSTQFSLKVAQHQSRSLQVDKRYCL